MDEDQEKVAKIISTIERREKTEKLSIKKENKHLEEDEDYSLENEDNLINKFYINCYNFRAFI